MNWSIPVAAASLFILIFSACAGGGAKSTSEFRVYTVRLEVLDEDGRPVNGVNVAGGDIFGETAQGGILERSMVDEGQFRQHLDASYRVEKFGCIVDQQQVRIDETSDNFATITLPLACSEPLVRLGRSAGALLFDGENIWLANGRDNTVTKVAIDGTVLGTFPVGHPSAKLAFDGENLWVAGYRGSLTKLDRNGQQEGTFSIEMTDRGNIEDYITDVAFDGEGIWVDHLAGDFSKLALDGTHLWTRVFGWPYEHLVFAGDRMVRVFNPFLGDSSVRTFDLEGNHLYSYDLDSDSTRMGNIRDAAFGGDGIWLAGSCGVAKVRMDGGMVLGPFQTLVCGDSKKLIFDGQYIWVLEHPDNGTSLVSKLSSDGQILGTFPVGFAKGGDLVFDGEGVWVLAAEDPTEAPTALWRIEP